MQIVLFSPTLGTLDLTANRDSSGHNYDLLLAGFDMGQLAPVLTAVETAYGSMQSETGFTDRTPTFYVASRAETEKDRIAGGEAIERWINAGDCELRYEPTDDDALTSCLLILSGVVSHSAMPDGTDKKFYSEWAGSSPVRWYQLTLTTAPQVLNAAESSTTLTGTGSASGKVTIAGSFAAACKITATATTGLSYTLLYSCPWREGYTPALRAFRSNATSTISVPSGQRQFYRGDSGQWRSMEGISFAAPASNFPAGEYAFLAHVKDESGTSRSIIPTVTVNTVIGGVTVDSKVAGSMSVPLSAGADAMITLGGITLDLGGIGPDVDATLQVVVTDVPDVAVDEVFAFWLHPDATLAAIDAGQGTPVLGAAHSLVSVAASPWPNERTIVNRGIAADPTQVMGPGSGLQQVMPPMLPAGDNFVFAATAGATGTVNAITSYRAAYKTYADAA